MRVEVLPPEFLIGEQCLRRGFRYVLTSRRCGFWESTTCGSLLQTFSSSYRSSSPRPYTSMLSYRSKLYLALVKDRSQGLKSARQCQEFLRFFCSKSLTRSTTVTGIQPIADRKGKNALCKSWISEDQPSNPVSASRAVPYRALLPRDETTIWRAKVQGRYSRFV